MTRSKYLTAQIERINTLRPGQPPLALDQAYGATAVVVRYPDTSERTLLPRDTAKAVKTWLDGFELALRTQGRDL